MVARLRAARAAAHAEASRAIDTPKPAPRPHLMSTGPASEHLRHARPGSKEYYEARREAAREFCAHEGLDVHERIYPHCLTAVTQGVPEEEMAD